jgi:hypothetical protein
MVVGLYIFVDDEFDDPVYASPKDTDELDPSLWEAACEVVSDALDEDGPADGVKAVAEHWVGWRCLVRQGVSFVAVITDDVRHQDVERYLSQLSRRYMDEVDDPRNPERDGVDDVVVDVIPPWEDGPED